MYYVLPTAAPLTAQCLQVSVTRYLLLVTRESHSSLLTAYSSLLTNMFRTLPPTAAPITFRDLFQAMVSTVSKNGAEGRFEDQIRKYFNVMYVFLFHLEKRLFLISVYFAAGL